MFKPCKQRSDDPSARLPVPCNLTFNNQHKHIEGAEKKVTVPLVAIWIHPAQWIAITALPFVAFQM